MDAHHRRRLPALPPPGHGAAMSGRTPGQAPTSSPEPSWRDWRATWPGAPGWLGVDWEASIWIGFLLPMIAFLLASRASLWAKILGACGLAAFAVIYVIEVSLIAKRANFARLAPASRPREEFAPAIRPLVLLGLCAVASTIAITWYSTVFLPYFCAIVLFTTRLRTGLMASAGMCLAALAALAVILAVGPGEPGLVYMTLGCITSSGFVVLSRFFAEQEAQRARQARAEAAMAEREEIGRDVHDILGHSLTVLTLKAEVAQRLLRRDPEAAERELAEVIDLSRAALADVRATATRLRTPDLASQIESSRTAFAAAGIDAEFTGRPEDLPLGQRELASWALREATTNILRHAGATAVRVALSPGRVVVADNGRGLNGAPEGNGLRGLRKRVETSGGEVRLVSPAPHPIPSPGGAGPGGAGPGTEMEVLL
ncbi:sensor histidine kinase [Actinomyces marmotae]|uniref:sensor histidine kinase n=1 Tax=Actinomyces marmotae TaxID=2737173 RepID=UPI001F351F73|nr:histidine kinase [Actinomyces marmotae]